MNVVGSVANISGVSERSIRWTQVCCEVGKGLENRLAFRPDLIFAHPVRDFNSLKGCTCRFKGFDTHHRFDLPLDEPMILLNDVVKII